MKHPHDERLNIVDLLTTNPSSQSFFERVEALRLSDRLMNKTIDASLCFNGDSRTSKLFLNQEDEKELSTEVLLLRHRFTELVFSHPDFRQAAITVVQNIYLFRERKIFFGTLGDPGDRERQEALLLLTSWQSRTSVPLAKTFQHLIVARVWNRISNTVTSDVLQGSAFEKLHGVVEKLNTLRNIYMILTVGLVSKLTSKINEIYKQSISLEDARQIGSFGVARASYRYHYSNGCRFSTYASRWVLKEIQRQALEGRLIKISSSLVEKYSRASRNRDDELESDVTFILQQATAELHSEESLRQVVHGQYENDPLVINENKQLHAMLISALDTHLSPKSSDILKRRYGLANHRGQEQSVVEIAKIYGVTRGSIYQLEQAAIKKLHNHFRISLKSSIPA